MKSGTCMRKDPIRSTILLFLSMPGVERVPGTSRSENTTQFRFKAEASQNSNSMTSFPVLKRRMETGSWPYWHSAVAVHHNQASTSRTPPHHIMHIYCSDCLCLTREYTVARYWRHTRSIRSRLCPRWPCKWHKCRDRVPKHLHHDARSGNCP